MEVCSNAIVEDNIKNLIFTCGDLKENERVSIITDENTKHIGEIVLEQVSSVSKNVEHISVPAFKIHGEEPSEQVSQSMLHASLIFGLTSKSMAHTQARLNASLNGAKYLSLPDYSMSVVSSKALSTDFRAISDLSKRLSDQLSSGSKVRVTASSGTNLEMNISGRKGNDTPGWCFAPGVIASPPDAEVNIAPNESKSNGVIVVDGSIPCDELGLLDSPISLLVEDGVVREISGAKSDVLWEIFNRYDEKARVIAEFGIGLNPEAKLCGAMLEDEGCKGTVHFGIGSNATIGGKNKVAFHLDHIVRNASVFIDNIFLEF